MEVLMGRDGSIGRVSGPQSFLLVIPLLLASGAPASNTKTPKTLLSDDFESYEAGQPPEPAWKTSVGGGTVAVDTARAYSGKKSVHFTTEAGGKGRRALIGKDGPPLFPMAGNAFFGRAMVWVSDIPPPAVHWTNVKATGLVPGTDLTAQYNYGGMHEKLLGNYATTNAAGLQADCWKSSKSPLPTKRWVCLEWHYEGPRDRMRFWVDGAAVDDLTISDGKGDGCVRGKEGPDGLWHAPTFAGVRLGWEHYQTSPIAIEMWLDDAAIGAERIGCPSARGGPPARAATPGR
jgi:hypothetical protein